MDIHDTIRLLVHLRNSPDLKLRAIVRPLIRADIRKARPSPGAVAGSGQRSQRRPAQLDSASQAPNCSAGMGLAT